MERQQTTGNSRWLRVSSVGAIVMGMVAVLALLPWHFLWNPQAGNKSTAVEPVKADVEPVKDDTAGDLIIQVTRAEHLS